MHDKYIVNAVTVEFNDSHIIIQSKNYNGSLKGHAMVCKELERKDLNA